MTSPAERGVRRATGVLAILVLLGVLAQSVFAGGLLAPAYGGAVMPAARTWHEVGANVTFALLALEGVLVVATPLRRDRAHLGSGVALGVVLTAVIGLGYVGGTAVALHVPLGVAAFGVAVWHAAAANGRRLVAARER